MALTARATEPPTWENQIVPTLRKRLEDESRALSKRMSLPQSPDDPQPPPLARSTSDQERSSHIPRPSIQSSLSEQETPQTRSRTHSTPRPFDRDILTPAPSRSTSPAVQTTPRPSRIPTRPRAGSRAVGTNDTAFPPSPDPSPDLWPVAEDALLHTKLTPPTPNRSDRRRKRDTFVPPPPSDNEEILFDEPAPFVINNGSNLARSSLDEYEHWYRGEGRGGGGRNGGRGEIRIATRTEMLEIASFGHPPSRSNSGHGHGFGDFGWRNKAYDDSTVGTRYIWQDENTENVLDEAPLTDLDDVDTDSMFHPGSQGAHTVESHLHQDARSDSHPTQEDARSIEPDPEPDGPNDPVTPVRPPPSRIARATSPSVGPGASSTSLVSRSGRSPTPSKARSPPSSKAQPPKTKSPARRGTAASVASKSPSPAAGPSQRSPPSGSTPKSPKVGVTNPGKNNTPSPRTRAQSTPKRSKKLSTSGPGPHPLADAIPQIPPNQQVPDDGNWDDVVLPTVARRMQGGDIVMLERKPWEEEEEPIPPAPGTFGFLERQRERELAKERERKRGSGTEMEEFGAWDGLAKKPNVEKQEERKKAPSPPPFSDYTPVPPEPTAPPAEPVRRQSLRPVEPNGGMVITEAELRQSVPGKNKSSEYDSHGAGCCKCVVM